MPVSPHTPFLLFFCSFFSRPSFFPPRIQIRSCYRFFGRLTPPAGDFVSSPPLPPHDFFVLVSATNRFFLTPPPLYPTILLQMAVFGHFRVFSFFGPRSTSPFASSLTHHRPLFFLQAPPLQTLFFCLAGFMMIRLLRSLATTQEFVRSISPLRSVFFSLCGPSLVHTSGCP